MILYLLMMMHFFNEDLSKFTFFANETGILSVYLDKINLDADNNFYEDNPENMIHAILLARRDKFGNHKVYEKDPSKE